MPAEFEKNTPQLFYIPLAEAESDSGTKSGLKGALDSYLSAVRSFIRGTEVSSPGAVMRVFLSEFHSILALHGEREEAGANNSSSTERAVAEFLMRLQLLIRSKRVVIVIDAVPSALPWSLAPPSTSLHHLARFNTLAKFAHTFITVDTFAGRQEQIPVEFGRFCGFLEIGSVQHLGTLMAGERTALWARARRSFI